jgi:hypothetical protein
LQENHFKGIVGLITGCTGFGMLPDFLSTMNKDEAKQVLGVFMAEINKKSDYDDLSKTALVLDTLESIADPELRGFFESLIKDNYENLSSENKVLYAMLASLYKGKAVKEKEWFEKIAGDNKPPEVEMLRNADLFNENGQNIQVHLFYDDRPEELTKPNTWDGHNSFKHFLAKYGIRADYDKKTGEFSPISAKKTDNFEFKDMGSFVYISVKDQRSGREIIVYANKPNKEIEGVRDITDLLHAHNQKPHVVVQRGHSYHIKKATEYSLIAEAELVFIAGCGGFTSGVKISQKTDAQIIATKQTGKMAINDDLLASINEYILSGRDINWDSFWQGKQYLAKAYPEFNYYIPPNKNKVSLLTRMYEKYKKTARSRLSGEVADTLVQ